MDQGARLIVLPDEWRTPSTLSCADAESHAVSCQFCASACVRGVTRGTLLIVLDPAAAVAGPGWVWLGLDESPGLYPLRVEPAVGRLVGRLLPGIITTTTGARYFGLHTLSWAEADRRKLEAADAELFVRRCEAVIAGVSLLHGESESGHSREVPRAHGEIRIARFFGDDGLDIDRASQLNGYSRGGFSGTYLAPERVLGLLDEAWPPRPAADVNLVSLRAGLGDVFALADRSSITEQELADMSHLCPCRAADHADGVWLRHWMFERAAGDRESDLNRQVTALMMLETFSPGGVSNPEQAFRLMHGFGEPIIGQTREALARRAWRAAILRNYSVSAWRRLWTWLSEQLAAGDLLTEQELGDLLASAVGDGSVAGLSESLPESVNGGQLLPAEEQIKASADPIPAQALRQLALGVRRLSDLDDETRDLFVGTLRDDLGPTWMRHQLDEYANNSVADLARHLLATMLVRARRVALSKMTLDESFRPYVPTRLRDRDGRLWMEGVESDVDVSLRCETLAQVLVALGAADRHGDGFRVSALGRMMDLMSAEALAAG